MKLKPPTGPLPFVRTEVQEPIGHPVLTEAPTAYSISVRQNHGELRFVARKSRAPIVSKVTSLVIGLASISLCLVPYKEAIYYEGYCFIINAQLISTLNKCIKCNDLTFGSYQNCIFTHSRVKVINDNEKNPPCPSKSLVGPPIFIKMDVWGLSFLLFTAPCLFSPNHK